MNDVFTSIGHKPRSSILILRMKKAEVFGLQFLDLYDVIHLPLYH